MSVRMLFAIVVGDMKLSLRSSYILTLLIFPVMRITEREGVQHSRAPMVPSSQAPERVKRVLLLDSPPPSCNTPEMTRGASIKSVGDIVRVFQRTILLVDKPLCVVTRLWEEEGEENRQMPRGLGRRHCSSPIFFISLSRGIQQTVGKFELS